MQIRLAILAIAALVAVVSLAAQPNQATGQEQQTAKQSQPLILTVDSQNKQASSQTDQPKPDPDPPNWYTAFENPDGMLVIVGLITCVIIGLQSFYTREAAQGAKENAIATNAQIEFMKSKERAQLRLEIDPLNLVYDQKADGYPIQLRVVLDGATRAIILNESIAAYLADSPPAKVMSWEPLGIPGTFTPDLSPMTRVIFIQADSDFCENETDHQRVNLVRERKLDVYVTGRIRYRDLFGDEWEFGIDRVWNQWGGWYDGGEGKITGVWTEAGNGKGDYHRKAEPRPTKSEIVASFKQRPKPN